MADQKEHAELSMMASGSEPRNLLIDGTVSRGFEPVREAFIENFRRRGELGAACCIYRHGEKVVDLWGGVRDRASGEPWRADTMMVVHSIIKGAAAMVLALLHSRGLLDYDARDPEAGIGYGYVTNPMGMHLHGDPRDVALRAALLTIGRRPPLAARG